MAPGEAESSPTYTTEKTGSGPIKKWFGPIFLTVYTSNNLVRLMIEKCNSTHARNHREVRQPHMKKMVRNQEGEGNSIVFHLYCFPALTHSACQYDVT